MKPNPRFSSTRGSALIVALIFAAVIAISLTSFLKLASNATKLADRSFYSNGAQNLADIGLEQVLWSLNNSNWTSSSGFTSWTGHSLNYRGTFPASTPYQFSQGVTGTVKVWVDASTSVPHAVSQATVTLSDGSTLLKVSEAYMSKKSYFTNGMVAKNTLTFNGNTMVDSWNSDPDNNPATAAIGYSAAVDSDGGKIASLSVQVASIAVGNGDIYGYAAVGGSTSADIQVGSTGRVGPYGTGNGVIDPTRVTYDFTTSFPDITAPAAGSLTHSYPISAISNDITLPVSGDLAAADGKYYYYVPSIGLSGNKTMSITAGRDVVVCITNTTGDGVSTTGNAGIVVPGTANFTLYCAADVKIAGNGLLNGTAGAANQPKNVTLYGTRPAATAAVSGMQDFQIAGNGYLSAVVYAPSSSVKINGNAEVYGAVVANDVTVVGNANFHYDESLANLTTTNIYGLTKWRELTTAANRATYATQLNF